MVGSLLATSVVDNLCDGPHGCSLAHRSLSQAICGALVVDMLVATLETRHGGRFAVDS
jgi:hypothetical protein